MVDSEVITTSFIALHRGRIVNGVANAVRSGIPAIAHALERQHALSLRRPPRLVSLPRQGLSLTSSCGPNPTFPGCQIEVWGR